MLGRVEATLRNTIPEWKAAAILPPQGLLGKVTHGGLQPQAELDAMLEAQRRGGRPPHGLQQGQNPREVPQPPAPHHVPGGRQRHPQGGG